MICISIHALRVEGDRQDAEIARRALISIHALRVEGDQGGFFLAKRFLNFYPRPPGGGRLVKWRSQLYHFFISIHALRVEGDP